MYLLDEDQWFISGRQTVHREVKLRGGHAAAYHLVLAESGRMRDGCRVEGAGTSQG